jgi:predicted nucleotidyltransferase component of viral defense system
LVELFSRAAVAEALAFRGGTALYKLHFRPAARYSEDIDLVQTAPGGVGRVEINTREHFTAYGVKSHRFEVNSRWFSGAVDVRTYELEELLGTKLRALYQRKKGRDLFDLGLALQSESVSPARIVDAFARYMQEEGVRVTRAQFEQNLLAKRADTVFTSDLAPLLASGQAWNFDVAFDRVWRELVARLPGDPWKGS